MTEMIIIFVLINTIVLFLIRRTVNKINDDGRMLSSRVDYLNREVLEMAKTLRSRGNAGQDIPEAASGAKAGLEADISVSAKQATETIQKAGIVKPPPIPVLLPEPVLGQKEVKTVVPEQPSKLVESAKEVLGKIWRWIVYGDENRREGVSTEVAVATTWLIRIGIIVVVMGAIYFLKWSLEKDLLSPAARVGASMIAGVGLLVFGIRLLGKKYHLMGQGFIGGGLLILYASAFSAGSVYHLFGPSASMPVAFALMILVTITAGVVAISADSMLVAIIGIAGGYMTPVLLRAPTPNLPGFYSYILLLSLGIMAIAYYKQWRLLNYLGFLCTYGLFIASLQSAYKPDDFTLAISFATAFLVVHSSIVYIHNIVRGNKSTTLEIIHLVANALFYAYAAYNLIDDKFGRPYPSIMSIGMSVFYILHVLVFLRKRLADRALLVALIALAGVFTTWTLPLILEKESLTISLSLLAFMFLWMGRKLSSNFMENLAHVMYCVVFFRLLYWDIPRNFSFVSHASEPMALYWKHMVARLWTFGISIASVIGGFFIQRGRGDAAAGTVIGEANNTPQFVSRGVAGGVFYWFAVLFMFLFAHLELNTMFMYYTPFRLPVLTVLWCVMGGYFLVKYLMREKQDSFAMWAMCAFMFIAVLKVFAFDLVSWHFSDSMIYDMEYSFLYAGTRLLDFGVLVMTFLAIWRAVNLKRGERSVAAAFGYGSLLLLFVYTSLELNSLLFWKMREFQRGGISILWALFAVGFTAGGIWKNVTPLRYLGLALFAVVAGKVFLVDLAGTEMIYRVVAFMVVGVILLLGAFAYLYSGKKFMKGGQS